MIPQWRIETVLVAAICVTAIAGVSYGYLQLIHEQQQRRIEEQKKKLLGYKDVESLSVWKHLDNAETIATTRSRSNSQNNNNSSLDISSCSNNNSNTSQHLLNIKEQYRSEPRNLPLMEVKMLANRLNRKVAVRCPTQLDLSLLRIGDEGIQFLTESVFNKDLSDLRDLNLSYNNVTDYGLECLLSESGNLITHLTSFKLNSNLLTKDSVKLLLTHVDRFLSLETFEIAGNQIEDEGIEYLAAFFKINRTITSLNLSSIEISLTSQNPNISKILEEPCGKGFESFASSLARNPIIKNIDLSSNDISEKGMEALSRAFSNCTLKTPTSLTPPPDTCHTPSETPYPTPSPSYSTPSQCTVTHLNLSSCNISKGIVHLSEMLRNNDTILKLNIGSNNIRQHEMLTLSKGLIANKTLQELDLSLNHLGHDGAVSVGFVLTKNKSLTFIDISNNKVGPAGVEFLSRSLRRFCYLKKLDLSSNDLTDAGTKHIIQVLKVNQTLNTLILADNLIGSESGKLLAEVISDSGLRTLNLDNNRLGDEGARALIFAVLDQRSPQKDERNSPRVRSRQFQRLREISLGSNCISDKAIIDIGVMILDFQKQQLLKPNLSTPPCSPIKPSTPNWKTHTNDSEVLSSSVLMDSPSNSMRISRGNPLSNLVIDLRGNGDIDSRTDMEEEMISTLYNEVNEMREIVYL